MNMRKINLPEDVKLIIESLEQAGYEAYAVGGCVRDTLLGKEPNDWDITTNALPEQMKKIFKRTIDTGIQHGTITVLIGKNTYELTTYRIDGEYEDNRHPKQVEYTTSLIEDLKRRDFTINAMAYNDSVGIVDEFDGVADLENGVIRCVGNARERFSEDALRMMRALRFAAQLGYSIEENTITAIRELCGNLSTISVERINAELTKLLVSPNPGMLRLAYATGVLSVILPQLAELMEVEQNNPHHCYTIGEHIIHSVEEIEADRVLRYAMLFHDLGKGKTKTTDENGIDHFHGHPEISAQMANTIMHDLHFDNDTIAKVRILVKNHDRDIIPKDKYVRRAMNDLGEGMLPLLLKVETADFMAQSTYKREQKQAVVDELWEVYNRVVENQDGIYIKDLAISGSDLIAIGVKPGPVIGKILEELLEEVLDNPECNTREYLLKSAKEKQICTDF